MPREVKAIHNWATNGELIADVASLYLREFEQEISKNAALDATYGRGLFWTHWRPQYLLTNDIREDLPTDYHYDFRHMEFFSGTFNLVAYDPPYKLHGTPALGDFDDRYGLFPQRWQDRMQMILDGFRECARVTDRWLLVKCQDQVVSGAMRWQTFEITKLGESLGMTLVDRFDMLGGGRPQPPGRRQVHARGRGSTLLVFKK